MKRCAITGSTGYLGGAFAAQFADEGWDVVLLSRRPADPDRPHRSFVLGEPVSSDALVGVDVLVHCAWDFGPRDWAEIGRVNVNGTRLLFDAAKAAGVGHIVFISSISAFSGCVSRYGKAKLECEELARNRDAAIIRPGLVYGERDGGLFGAISSAVRRLPVVPVISGGGQQLFTCHIRDLSALVLAAAAGPFPVQPVPAGHPQAWTMGGLVGAIATGLGRRPLTLPVPWQMVWLGLRTFELIGWRGSFRADSVIGLIRPTPETNFALCADVSTPFRPFDPGAA